MRLVPALPEVRVPCYVEGLQLSGPQEAANPESVFPLLRRGLRATVGFPTDTVLAETGRHARHAFPSAAALGLPSMPAVARAGAGCNAEIKREDCTCGKTLCSLRTLRPVEGHEHIVLRPVFASFGLGNRLAASYAGG